MKFLYLCNINNGLIDYTLFFPAKLTIDSINILQKGIENEMIKNLNICKILNVKSIFEIIYYNRFHRRIIELLKYIIINTYFLHSERLFKFESVIVPTFNFK